MQFPAPFATILRERPLLAGLVISGVALVILNLLGIGVWPCTFKMTTGLPCPGCGMTRAMKHLGQGNVATALHYHPFSPAIFAGALIMTVVLFLPRRLHAIVVAHAEAWERRTGLTTWIILGMLGYGIWRMVVIWNGAPSWL
jgi:hypothetical protein